MREAKWWLRGQKLVQRSRSNRLIPRADDANAPPFLPLDPVIESKAVHNMGGYQVDEGRDDWFLGQDNYLNEDAAPPPADQGGADSWDWGSDYGCIDDTMVVEITAQTSHLDPGDLADVWEEQPAVEAGYDDPTTDLVEASTGPVQPNAPNPEGGYSDEWDFFDEPIPLHVVPGDYLQSDVPIVTDRVDDLPPADEIDPDDWWHALDAQQDPNELAEGDDWYDWHESAVDSIHDILDEDDDAAGPDQPPMPVDDGWPWQIQDDVGEPFDLHEPAGITLPALPYSDDFPLDDAIEDTLPADDVPQAAVVVVDQPQDDTWPWEEALPLDVVPSGYLQADRADLPRQEGDDVPWDWSEDGGQSVMPGGYMQSDYVPPGPPVADSHWHWESDVVEDEWREFIEGIGSNGASGSDTGVGGDPRMQNLLRRRDDFETMPVLEEPWNWYPLDPDDAWWPEPGPTIANFSPIGALLPDDAWDWFSADTEEAPLDSPDPGPNRPVDPEVGGNPYLQDLLRRRDDFETDPPRDHDWDYPLDAPTEEWELGSAPVVDAQVLFLEVPVDDAADHFPPQPDTDWPEPSEPVGADAAADLPRFEGDHQWAQWEDGEGDYEIEPSQSVDAPGLAMPDAFNHDEEAVEDTSWHAGVSDFQLEDAPPPIPGPTPVNDAWDFTADATDDTWWHLLPTPDTDGTTGPDLCPMLLAEAYARIAELEAELAECRRHHGDGGYGGGASGDGDDIHHDHGHHRDHDAEQRHLLEMHERDERERKAARRAQIEKNNALILGIVAATIHGPKGPRGKR